MTQNKPRKAVLGCKPSSQVGDAFRLAKLQRQELTNSQGQGKVGCWLAQSLLSAFCNSVTIACVETGLVVTATAGT